MPKIWGLILFWVAGPVVKADLEDFSLTGHDNLQAIEMQQTSRTSPRSRRQDEVRIQVCSIRHDEGATIWEKLDGDEWRTVRSAGETVERRGGTESTHSEWDRISVKVRRRSKFWWAFTCRVDKLHTACFWN